MGKLDQNQRVMALIKAFEQDNYTVSEDNIAEFQGKIGMMATHKSAVNTVTGEPKKVYYVEGSHYQMGYLLGMVAEKDIERMTSEFVPKIIPAFIFGSGQIKDHFLEQVFEFIEKVIVWIVYQFSKSIEPDIPDEYKQEMQGIIDGCKKADPKSTVDMEDLWVLNVGIDCLLAHIYTGRFFSDLGIHPAMLKVPIMCNAFSIFGDAAQDQKHFFGRDFMFPTAGVFQDLACLIIYNPDDGIGMVSQTAPGMMGSIAAMNLEGVSIGVDMSPSQLCNPSRPGFNSLLLARHCIQQANSAEEVVKMMEKSPRGVSWLYAVGDGKNDRACVIEAGRTTGGSYFPYYKYVPRRYRSLLPDMKFIKTQQRKYNHPAPYNGLIVRWNDYTYPKEYITEYNENLWNKYDANREEQLEAVEGEFKHVKRKNVPHQAIEIEMQRDISDYNPKDFGELGFINKTYKDKNCPSAFYFAPQRETRRDVVLVSNHCVTPEMRLTAMNDWVSLIVGSQWNDIQWRYDELNYQILTSLKEGPINWDTARNLIDFLAPYGKFPGYYNSKNQDWRTVVIHGSISLFELKDKKVASHFGYYGDQWIEVNLNNYFTD